MDATMSDPSVFGRRLRFYRNRAGLTLEQLAERVGITLLSLHRYESGARYPQLDVFARLADALGLSLDDLVNPEEPVTPPAEEPPASRPAGKRK